MGSRAHDQLHAGLLQLQNATARDTAARRTEALRRLLRDTMQQLLRGATDRLKAKLVELLQAQFADLRRRLYEGKVGDASRSVSRQQCVFIPAFVQFARTLLNAVGGDAGGCTRARWATPAGP